ncbi:MAG: hypothetical protein ACOC5E_00600 [Acidobacteriota bacterium]
MEQDGPSPDRGTVAGDGSDADSTDWQAHPSVNTERPCPWCGTAALHEQHCKQICLACGWYRSCVD